MLRPPRLVLQRDRVAAADLGVARTDEAHGRIGELHWLRAKSDLVGEVRGHLVALRHLGRDTGCVWARTTSSNSGPMAGRRALPLSSQRAAHAEHHSATAAAAAVVRQLVSMRACLGSSEPVSAFESASSAQGAPDPIAQLGGRLRPALRCVELALQPARRT